MAGSARDKKKEDQKPECDEASKRLQFPRSRKQCLMRPCSGLESSEDSGDTAGTIHCGHSRVDTGTVPDGTEQFRRQCRYSMYNTL